MRRVFVRFLEEIEDTKETFRNYLTLIYSTSVSYQKEVSVLQFKEH